MKKKIFPAIQVCSLLLFFGMCISGNSQNVGIGTNYPGNKLEVVGNFLINQPLHSTNSQPTPAQSRSMINGTFTETPSNDSTFRIYDPGGPTSNYIDNLNASVLSFTYTPGNEIGYEMIVEQMDLRAGDSLIIRGSINYSLIYYAVGNNYTTTGRFIFHNAGLHINFKSNGDGLNGSGFSIVFKRLYPALSPVPAPGVGKGFLFDVNKGAFKGGNFTPETYGNYSFSAGNLNRASGEGSTAFGMYSHASGVQSTALGGSHASGSYALAAGNSNASGNNSVALGDNNHARGESSVALGYGNTAEALATAIGYYCNASAAHSLALGYGTSTTGYYAMASGLQSTAGGYYSSAFGLQTTSPSYACMSIGQNNYSTPTSGSSWVSTDPVFLVGNGVHPGARSNILEFYKNGNLGVASGYYVFSDYTLKKDISPIQNSLQKILQLNGYNYFWKDSLLDNRQQSGFLAQEVQAVIPDLVHKNLKGELMVNYNGIIPYLIESIKVLHNKTAETRSVSTEIQELIKRIEVLEEQNKKLTTLLQAKN